MIAIRLISSKPGRCLLALAFALWGCEGDEGGNGGEDAGDVDARTADAAGAAGHDADGGADPGWRVVESGTTETLCGLWGASADDVWAVGEHGTIVRFDGTAWSAVASGTTAKLEAVWGSGANDVWAVGGVWDGDLGTGTILHYDGSGWSVEVDDASQPLVALWGSSADDVIAVGGADSGVELLRFDGVDWQPMDGPPSVGNSLEDSWTGTGLWGTGPDEVFLTTFNTVARHDGESWHVLGSGLASSRPPSAVWGSSSTDVYVGHLIGGIRHWDGARWSDVLPIEGDGDGHANVYDLWGDGAADVYAVGGYWGATDTKPSRGFADGAILVHFDGKSWSKQDVRALSTGLNAVWGSSAADVWAAGDHGTLLHKR